MSNDDSFNDSDEVFSLYSSKNVMETFKSQLKKIVAHSTHSTKVFSHVNKGDCCDVTDKTAEVEAKADKTTEEEVRLSKNTEEDANRKLVSCTEKRTQRNDKDDLCVENRKECSIEDGIEIVEEVRPNSTRRSRRLRNRREECTSAVAKSLNNSPESAAHKRVTRQASRKKRRQKRNQGKVIDEITLDDSPQPSDVEDELNPEISVKVIWKSVNIKKFNIRKFQKLAHIYEKLSKEEGLPEDRIILTFNNVKVNRNDTPESLNLQVYHFLDGGELCKASNLIETSNSNVTESFEDSITLKFQDANKKTVVLSINKNEKLKVGMIKCSEQLDVPLSKIKFFFDGDLLQPSETPKSLGLENGEVIDMKITD